jgi:hypothetical protein
VSENDDWGRPAEVGGEFVKPVQLNGHLIIVFPLGYIPFIATKFSGQSGKPSDGIAVDVIDLDDLDDYGNPGKVYRNNSFMQSQLIASLKSQIGNKILGVMSQGTARNGMNPPWVIVDMSADPAALERGAAWKALNPNFRPSTFTPRAAAPVAPAQPPAQNYQQPNPGYSQPGQGYQQPQSGGYQAPPQNYQQPVSPPQGGGYQQPAAPPQYQQPQYQQPAQQQPAYVAAAGSPQISQEDMTVLQQHRAARAAVEAEAARQASFNDQPPF